MPSVERLHAVWLVFALAAVSATRFRFASIPVGLGELMLSAWLIAVAPKAFARGRALRPMQKHLLAFWLPLFVLLTLGAVWAFLGGVSSPGAARDVTAFAFAAVASLAFAGTLGATIPLRKLIRWIVVVLSVYLGILGLIHLASPELVTRPEVYGTRLTGFTANPNQLGMYLAPLPFVTLYLLLDGRSPTACAASTAAVLAQMLAGAAVASDALALAWLTGAVGFLVAAWHFRRLGRPLPNQALVVLLSGAIAAYGASGFVLRHTSAKDLNADLSAALAGTWTTTGSGHGNISSSRDDSQIASGAFEEGSPRGKGDGIDWEKVQIRTRAGLWRSGLEVVGRSPLVGYGPGRHAGIGVPFQGDEVHQSFVDLATMGGIPAALLLAWILWRAAAPRRRMGPEGYAACIIIAAVTVFASFHFMVRQPVFWFYIVLAGALSRSAREATALQGPTQA